MRKMCTLAVLGIGVGSLTFGASASAQTATESSNSGSSKSGRFSLAQASGQEKPAQPAPAKGAESTTVEKTTVTTYESSESGFKGVSGFFNIREANSNLVQGEWDFEWTSDWATGHTGGDDDFRTGVALLYGISDTMFAEIELERINLGDGGDQGAGETSVKLFNQFWNEDGGMPAFAMWAAARLPTGEGSEGVDAELHFNLTKTLADRLRGHLEGYVKTANGSRGGEGELDDWRHFQCGFGPGLDYEINENTVGVLNYLFSASEQYAEGSAQILEVGVVHHLSDTQSIKAAFDTNVDGANDQPNFGAKFQWSIEWK